MKTNGNNVNDDDEVRKTLTKQWLSKTNLLATALYEEDIWQ